MSESMQPAAPPRKGASCLLIVLGVLGGGALLILLLCGGTIFWFTRVPRGSAAAREPFVYDQVPLPDFPDDRGDPIPTEDDASVSRYEILLGEQGGYYETPGDGGKLWVYLPSGEHPPQSLPCVLFPPGRIDHLVGSELSILDEEEHTLYVKAGCVVVAYEFDGRWDVSFSDDPAYQRQFAAFKNTCGGMVNARNALEYALRKIPEVNPRQVFVTGLTAGGTHALLFAAHEPRLAGVMALEPTIDLPTDEGALTLRMQSESQPDLIDFVTQISPHTHAKRIKCPTFLFYQQVEKPLVIRQIPQGKDFVNRLKRQGTNATLTIVKDEFSGGAKVGIPPSIDWLLDQIDK